MPEISVIIPCYNVERQINRCLLSITNQTIGLDAIEIICVDDASYDNTPTLLKEWESKYPDNITIVRCDTNSRQGACRNIGLSFSRGEYIAFIDSDDWVELDYLEKLFTVATANDYDMVCCGYGRDYSSELTYYKEDLDSPININTIVGNEYIISSTEDRKNSIIRPIISYTAWGKLIKSGFITANNLFFPEHLTYEDAGWASLVNLYYKKIFILDESLYHYYVNDNSTVLVKDSFHHIDCITIQTWVWNEYHARGFMHDYMSELEIEHIYMGYLAGLKVAILRFDKPNYNMYLLLRQIMLSRIGNYKNNPYIKQGILSELHTLMLGSIDTPFSKSEFIEFANNLKQIGI